MGGIARNNEPSKTANDKSRKPQPPPDTDEDYEDGDIATPKRDRYGTDDEPL
jgi:hypothetical protein